MRLELQVKFATYSTDMEILGIEKKYLTDKIVASPRIFV